MSSLLDTQLGTLTFDGYEFCGVLKEGVRATPIALEVEGADLLPSPCTLLPFDLAALVQRALSRARDEHEEQVQVYVEHHMEEIGEEVWSDLLEGDGPVTAERVRAQVRLRRIWGRVGTEVSLNLDYGLPESVTDYVLSIAVGSDGAIEDVVMES